MALPDLFECRMVTPTGRIAVVLHLHYPELWPEMRRAIEAIPEPFDLFVSLTLGAGEHAARDILAAYPEAKVFRFPNRGRDTLPFLALAGTGVLFKYDLVCKLHAKRTTHRPDGDAWRERLVGGILGSRALVERIVAAFDADPDLGIVVADGQVFGGRPEHWVDNRERLAELGARIGLPEVPEGAVFPGGSVYWMRPFLLRTLAGLDLKAEDFEHEPLPRDGSTAHAVERLVGLVCSDAGMHIAESGALGTDGGTAAAAPKVHLIPYYLPQFHPTPENNAWWGAGFTEWSNATRTKPMFRHHRQPRLPADLGFYDLRLPETREAQAKLARSYGLSAFCYYYYWFDGRGVLRQPLDDMLASGRPDYPFLLCWANEPWSRNWDGGDREVLLPQGYAEGWVQQFARDIAPILRDPRYFRHEGRPVLLIYRIMHIPRRLEAMVALRAELRRLDVGEVHLAAGWVGFQGDDELPADPGELGVDAFFEFPPHRLPAAEITGTLQDVEPGFTGKVYSYESAIASALAARSRPGAVHRHPCVMMGWDNTARRMRRAHVFHGATPAKFRRWLRAVVHAEQARPGPAERLVFINAWNEWAEGTHLEPDTIFGRGWLEAVASASGHTRLAQAREAAP